jgi:hypothetical protein
MRKSRLLVAVLGAVLALCALCAAVASAEDVNSPELLILEGSSVTELKGTLKGGANALSTLGGKSLSATGFEGAQSRCKASASSKDTTLCEVLITIKGLKQGTVNCRSEMENGEGKDAVETILFAVDLHLAAEKTTSGELQSLALFKVLGSLGGEAELVMNCGGVKDKIRGVIACLATPGLTTVAAGGILTLNCEQNATTHDAITGECEKLCEWLKEHPFESNLGAGFEDTWMNLKAEATLNFSAFIDD